MKNLVLTFSILGFLFSSHAQCVDTTYHYEFEVGTNISHLVSRSLSTINGMGLASEMLTQNWVNNNWINTEKSVTVYFPDSNVQSNTGLLWQNNTWVNYFRYTSTQDINGNKTSELWQDGINNTWQNIQQDLITYDANNNWLEILRQNWVNNAWQNDYKYNYTYNSNNKMTQQLYSEWVNNAWLVNNKYDFTLDAAGNRVKSIRYEWDQSTNNWKTTRKDSSTYNLSNLMLFSYSFNYNGSSFVPYSRQAVSYNGLAKITLLAYDLWDIQTNSWRYYQKYNYTYNGAGLESETNFQRYNSTLSMWENNQKYLIQYNANNQKTSFENFSDWNAAGNYYADRTLSTFSYCQNATAIEQLNRANFKLFPNPISDNQLTIIAEQKSDFQISDISGKIVLEGEVKEGENTINDLNFQPSIYIIKIGNQTKKIIKQ